MSAIDGFSGDYMTLALGAPEKANAMLSSTSSATALKTQPAFSPAANTEPQLSPLGQVASTLPQLQRSDPAKYREVAQQIAASLQSDAQTANSEGEIANADRLKELASAFTTAAQNGELPNLGDLVALGGV
jgi:hypothetical protein